MLSLQQITRRGQLWLGVEQNSTSHLEKLVSGAGCLIGVALVYALSRWSLGETSALVLVASMGSSAVLVFAAPHAALSQPWPVLGGNLVSAVIGVTCAGLVSDTALASSLALGLAVVAMYYLRCLHPPGGATALVAVIGGEPVRQLGYDFVFSPILVNMVSLLVVAVIFNGLFPWRVYPHGLHRRFEPSGSPAGGAEDLGREDIQAALQHLDSFVDIDPDDLLEVYELARVHARGDRLPALDLPLEERGT